MFDLLTQETTDLKCPTCHQAALYEFSSIAPRLFKCEKCQDTHNQAYVFGYWQGYRDHQIEVNQVGPNGIAQDAMAVFACRLAIPGAGGAGRI